MFYNFDKADYYLEYSYYLGSVYSVSSGDLVRWSYDLVADLGLYIFSSKGLNNSADLIESNLSEI